MDLNEYSSKSVPVFGTLKEFITEGAKHGFVLFKPEGQVGPVMVGKNDRPCLLFKSKNSNEIILYISRNLDNKLSIGENYDLADCLVYEFESELILGINASKFEPVDITKYSNEELNDFLMSYYKKPLSDDMKTERTRVRRNRR